jgi:hypothetical protein
MKKIVCLYVAYGLVFAIQAQPVITQQPTNQTAVVGGSGTFNVAASGIGPFTYQWQVNGTNRPYDITTFAGNGTNAYSGDGGLATGAGINYPIGIAIDGNGNLFFTSSGSRIRKVSTNGIITTVAGNGTSGYNGDGGLAINANICNDSDGVAVDGNGNLFFTDYTYSVIREVNTNGIITTVVGNGAKLSGPQGVAVDGNSNLFIADTYNYCIRKVGINGIIMTVAGNGIQGYSGDGGSATGARLNMPSGIAVDGSGNVFFADYGNNRIRKIDTNGIIMTIAGNGTNGYTGDGGLATSAEISQPNGIAVDGSGNVFFAGGNAIRKVSTNGIITTVAGIWDPYGVAVDGIGNVFVADFGSSRISKVLNLSQYASFILNPISTSDAGNYSVVIANSSGSVTSSVVTLTVVPAIITQQPSNQLMILGGGTVFSVGVSNVVPVAYQWYLSSLITAGATAQMLSGFVYGIAITNGGAGYTTVPRVQFIGGGGSGAGGTASITNGQVTSITMTNAGSGYTSSPVVLIDPPTGLLAGKTNATLNLSAITTNNAGGYYVVITNSYGSITSSVAALTIAYPPSISQQPQNQTVGAGSGANFKVTAAGTSPFGYQWWMTGGQQSNATANPVVINGFVLAATMTSGGAGYLAIPSVQFVGGSGSRAGGNAVVSNRMVSAITMTNAGSGYTTPPTIQIAAPTAICLTGQTNRALSLLALGNTNAGNYYVVVTNNYGSVTSILASLTVALPGYNQISSPVLNNGKMSLSFVGIGGGNYALDRSFSLAPANWIPQITNRADANGNLIFNNTPVITTNNFWRIRSVP